jgi:hypothetical protein
VPPAALDTVRRAAEASSRATELLRHLSGVEQDLAGAGRIFGEGLPAGLVLAATLVG